MNRNEILDLAKWTTEQAKRNGADESGVDIVLSSDVEISHRDGQLDKLKESTQHYLGLSIYANERFTSHNTNDIRKETLGKFIEQAVAMTKYLGEDPFRTLPSPKYYMDKKHVELMLWDSNHNDLTSEQRIQYAKELDEAAHQRSSDVISCTAEFSDNSMEHVKFNSNGFEGYRRGTSYVTYGDVTVKDGDTGRPSDYDIAVVRYLNDLPSAAEIGKRSTERALSKVGQAKINSGRYHMVVENRALSRLLYALLEPMSGNSLQQKSSFLEGKLGQKIISEKLTIIDDPFIVGGLGSRLFDSEGMTTKRRVMIDRGKLESYYIDTYYGKKLKMEPTIGSPTNTIFEYGDNSLDDLIKLMDRGILVKGFIGGNSNSTTGDFSYGVSGWYVENGKPVKPVYEMNISGNFTELLNKLSEVGNDPYEFSSFKRPSMLFEDVNFSGV